MVSFLGWLGSGVAEVGVGSVDRQLLRLMLLEFKWLIFRRGSAIRDGTMSGWLLILLGTPCG